MWSFKGKKLPAVPADKVPVGTFFLGSDDSGTYQLCVLCGQTLDNDTRYGVWFTGPKAFQLIDFDPFTSRQETVLQLPLSLDSVELLIPTQSTKNTKDQVKLGRLIAGSDKTVVIVGWAPRHEGGHPGWHSMTFEGMIDRPVHSELFFDKWGLAYTNEDGKSVQFFTKE